MHNNENRKWLRMNVNMQLKIQLQMYASIRFQTYTPGLVYFCES